MDIPRLFSRLITHLLFLSLGSLPVSFAADDPELTNYKSGIDLKWLGEPGVDYQEEYLYFDKVISDKKIVYIKAGTKISMSHNEQNRAGVPESTDKYHSVGLDIGKIRYKVDGDQRAEIYPNSYTMYDGPMSFDQLNYELYGDPQVPVVGSTGDNGIPLLRENKLLRYYRGMLDSTGDEWHTLSVLDDDSDYSGSVEFESSDGKVFLFVVNPKTPALTVRVTGTGQFYTTPPKKYFEPRIFDLTTYFQTGTSGDVSFEINDINGNKVHYRINGGTYISPNASTVTLKAANFKDGENLLEYYYAGNESIVRKRLVVKNPPFPSASEKHGDRLWLDSDYWENDIKPRLRTDSVWWLDQWRKSDVWSSRDTIDSFARQGRRLALTNAALPNAICAKVYGSNYKHPNFDRSYADYAKLALFESPTVIDPLGAELSTSNRPIPCREIIYRGYYDINSFIDVAVAYDILIGQYRTDQGFKNGISPIEDYYIRDSLASWVNISILFDFASHGSPIWDKYNTGGMWDTARKVGAALIVAMLPNYSTPYYGTSGMNGQEAIYYDLPFPDLKYTWKQLFFDNNLEMAGFPNLDRRLGIEEYMIDENGNFTDRPGYLGAARMGHVFGIYYNLIKLFTPTVKMPRLEALKNRAPTGELYGLKIISSSDSDPTSQVFLCWQNRWHPKFKEIAYPITLGVTNEDSENHIGKQTARGGPLYVLWYNHNIPVPEPPNGNPSTLQTKDK